MDSLVANYASSDEEQEQDRPDPHSPINQSKFSPSLFSLPPPKSSPPSHKHHHQEQQPPAIKPTSTSLFSYLPPPKTRQSDPKTLSTPSSSSNPKPKKTIYLRPPIIPIKSHNVDNEEDDDCEKLRKSKKDSESSSAQTTSAKPSFSSLLPKPKNSTTLGALSSGSGTGRRAILEAGPNSSNFDKKSEVGVNLNAGNNESQLVEATLSSMGNVGVSGGDNSNWGVESENFVNYDSYGGYDSNVGGGGDRSNWGVESGNYANYDGYVGYGNYGEHGNNRNYESNWVDGSNATVAPEVSAMGEGAVRVPWKRGRNDVPIEVIEVKQDELMKNRPREDQAKLTGIAFGPSYQPVSSAKGKPSKLHKRKHQIGSLFFDLKQKEMELAERRSKGFLTKAETQAKYGW